MPTLHLLRYLYVWSTIVIGYNEFEKKQLVFVFMNRGEKLSFRNGNMIVRDSNGSIKFQSTCYRIFSLFIIGDFTITSGLIAQAHKYCFSILLMNSSLRAYGSFGFSAEGNTQLRNRQYTYASLNIAQRIIANKISSQSAVLKLQRYRGDYVNDVIRRMENYKANVYDAENIHELMGIEGAAARVYFSANFNNCKWESRKPRIKSDYINATLDIGYTLLFNYIENLLHLYGFDIYKGVMHQEFYQRKSLVCDLVEPFRPLIDWQIRKSISLGQCQEEHFDDSNGIKRLAWSRNKEYVLFLFQPLSANKEKIFTYIRDYYRAFAQDKAPSEYPWFEL